MPDCMRRWKVLTRGKAIATNTILRLDKIMFEVQRINYNDPINFITALYFRYEERLGSLQSKVKELEVTASKQAQSERADDARLRELVHGLKVENADLLSKLKNLELEHEDKNDLITMLKVQLGTYYQILSINISNILNQSAEENFYI